MPSTMKEAATAIAVAGRVSPERREGVTGVRHSRVLSVHADTRKEKNRRSVAATTMKTYGRPDIAVTNAGVSGTPVVASKTGDKIPQGVPATMPAIPMQRRRRAIPVVEKRQRGTFIPVASIATGTGTRGKEGVARTLSGHGFARLAKNAACSRQDRNSCRDISSPGKATARPDGTGENPDGAKAVCDSALTPLHRLPFQVIASTGMVAFPLKSRKAVLFSLAGDTSLASLDIPATDGRTARRHRETPKGAHRNGGFISDSWISAN